MGGGVTLPLDQEVGVLALLADSWRRLLIRRAPGQMPTPPRINDARGRAGDEGGVQMMWRIEVASDGAP